MSALHCEPKSWWIYKVAVRSFPHSYKSLALSKFQFQMTLPQQYTHSSAVFLNFSAQWQKQRLWKCYKTERWAWLGLILIPKVCSNFRTCGFSCMINDWSMSEPHPLPFSFCKCTKSVLAKAIALCQRVDVVKKCIFIE